MEDYIYTDKDSLHVNGPEYLDIDGRKGFRYWIYKQTTFFKNQDKINEKLSGFPFSIFLSVGKNPEFCPTIILFQVTLLIMKISQ